MNQTSDYHSDPSSICVDDVDSIDGVKWFTAIHDSPAIGPISPEKSSVLESRRVRNSAALT
jgi:hypothetical protein